MTSTTTHQGRRSLTARLVETIRFYGPLGFVAFGGPSANIVLIRKIFVQQQQWLDDATFNDLLALGNALPGPAFSQLAFSISALRGGILAALLSFVLLTAPGAIIMIGIGFAVKRIPDTLPPIVFGLFTGLNASAVGLVALAAYQLSKKVITDKTSRLLLFFSATIACCYESQWLYPVLMVAGGSTTIIVDSILAHRARQLARKTLPIRTETPQQVEAPSAEEIEMEVPRPQPAATKTNSIASGVDTSANVLLRRTTTRESKRYPTPPLEEESRQQSRNDTISSMEQQVEPEEEVYFNLSVKGGLAIGASFIVVLIVMLAVRGSIDHNRILDFTTNLLLAGTIIFGGGPVVIPLLRGYTVDPGWVTPRDFLLGFAIIQALPGPVFNFCGFLGVLVVSEAPIAGGALGLLAIFLPGIALKLAFLPLYQKWKTATKVRSILRGLNAAAVGLIFSATYRLFRVGFIQSDPTGATPAIFSSLDRDGFWVSTVAAAFVACESFGCPTPLAILGGAIGGMAWYGVQTTR
ncbi:putative chromate ion transporter [Leucosporidium creatinivorum]|uniref:Putative chromate ion transporter n=1 Tax=Leucosporidium creatinivorum TaxID=106004 RepID=A0A1Y2G2T7_9BASI|nr:putative chromate ion transporter [Leucosporidium creatinivorum]